jgi:uncharacterized protein (DUF427 family)
MAEVIKVSPAIGKWFVRAGGAVLGETTNALEVREGVYDPVIYFPRSDIAMGYLDSTDKLLHCPYKGAARYYSVVTKDRKLEDQVWSYEAPRAQVCEIKDYLAFRPTDKITVEQF